LENLFPFLRQLTFDIQTFIPYKERLGILIQCSVIAVILGKELFHYGNGFMLQ